MKLVTFGIDKDRNFDSSIPSFYSATYSAAVDTVSERNSTSSY